MENKEKKQSRRGKRGKDKDSRQKKGYYNRWAKQRPERLKKYKQEIRERAYNNYKKRIADMKLRYDIKIKLMEKIFDDYFNISRRKLKLIMKALMQKIENEIKEEENKNA